MRTLLFIHGFATGPAVWQEQLREFSRDFRVVTDPGRIEHGSSVFIVAWSMGGWKALDLWQEHQQKIRGLVLVSAFAKYVKSADYPCGAPPALLRKLERKFVADYQSGLYYFYELIFGDSKSKYDRLVENLPVPGKGEVIKWFNRLKNDDKRDLLPKINLPALIIHGDRDPVVSPEAAKYLSRRIKHSELRIFPGAGHAPFLEATEKFNSILKDFLAKNADR